MGYCIGLAPLFSNFPIWKCGNSTRFEPGTTLYDMKSALQTFSFHRRSPRPGSSILRLWMANLGVPHGCVRMDVPGTRCFLATAAPSVRPPKFLLYRVNWLSSCPLRSSLSHHMSFSRVVASSPLQTTMTLKWAEIGHVWPD